MSQIFFAKPPIWIRQRRSEQTTNMHWSHARRKKIRFYGNMRVLDELDEQYVPYCIRTMIMRFFALCHKVKIVLLKLKVPFLKKKKSKLKDIIYSQGSTTVIPCTGIHALKPKYLEIDAP